MKDAVTNLLLKLALKIGDGRLKMEDSRGGEDRRLKIEGRGLGISPQVEAMLTARPVWGVEEAKATAAFLNSPAGELFSKRIRSVAAHVAIEGANDRANTIHSAGVSAGWNECVRYIHSLSRVSGEQDTQQGAASHLKDRYQPEGEAELLERLSP